MASLSSLPLQGRANLRGSWPVQLSSDLCALAVGPAYETGYKSHLAAESLANVRDDLYWPD